MGIKWYLKYAWVKLNIWILTPFVKIEKLYNAYKQARLESYVKYICTINNYEK